MTGPEGSSIAALFFVAGCASSLGHAPEGAWPAGLEARGFEPFVQEFYDDGAWRGRIVLDVRAQRLEFALRTNTEERAFALDLERVPRFRGVTFRGLGSGLLLLGGLDSQAGLARIVQVDFSGPEVRHEELHWTGPTFPVAGSLALLPDRDRAVILDPHSDRVFVLRLSTRVLEEVEAARGALSSARFVFARTFTDDAGSATAIVLAETDETGQGLGTLSGRSLWLLDRDGDGRFEAAR
jgi:hypothetical protein